MGERELDYVYENLNVENIILENENKIYSLCYYMLKNKEDAMDVMQDVCIKIFKYIKGFSGKSKLSTWVYRITYNTCIDYIKRRKNEISYEDYIMVDIESQEQLEDVIEKRELRNDVRKCILKLHEPYRSAITLRDINGFTYDEIADILNINLGTVKSRLNRARSELKKEIVKAGIYIK